jgi:hypothetical protein
MDAEHLGHARARAMWGMMLLWAFFGIWELVRLVNASLQGEALPHTTGIIIWILAVLLILFVLPFFLFPKKGGGH